MDLKPQDFRGRNEILGLSFSAAVVAGVVVVQILHGLVPDHGLIAALLTIVGVTVARSSQGAAERSGSSNAINAAANELRTVAAQLKAPDAASSPASPPPLPDGAIPVPIPPEPPLPPVSK